MEDEGMLINKWSPLKIGNETISQGKVVEGWASTKEGSTA